MKIKKITITEEEQDVQLPLYLKRADNTEFLFVNEKEVYNVCLYQYVSPSLYVWNSSDEERLSKMMKDYCVPSSAEEFKEAVEKFKKGVKEFYKKEIEKATSALVCLEKNEVVL